MCGVFFISSKKDNLDRKLCLKAFKTLKTRGPDKQLYEFLNEKNFLGNTILSITGKVKKGKSLYGNNKFKLSFNGEIYNYKILQSKYNFKNDQIKSDTDLLLKLNIKRGPLLSAKNLEGMFAYCFFNKEKNLVSFVTDPQGEKKLFIYNDKNFFIVSSTILAIKKFIGLKDINYDVLNDYFSTRHFLLSKKTIYKNLTVSKFGNILEYNIKDQKITNKSFFNIFKLINKKKYLSFQKKTFSGISTELESLMKKKLNLMVPNRKFASIFTGGVDSSVISALLIKLKKPNLLACLDHKNKDNTISKTKIMSRNLNNIFFTLNITSKQYFKYLKKVYVLLCHPFSTHDFIGRFQISEYFKRKKCKVYFVGDGADELFGGYEKYKKNIWINRKNSSPYSSFKNISHSRSELKDYINNFWNKAFSKYYKFLSLKEASIQASLFLDYFIQCVSVGNIGTDLMSGENSVEARTPFIQKDVIEFAVNLPLKHKINFKSKNKNFITKPILKNIFLQFYNRKFLFKKQGFPGFPNECIKYFNNHNKKEIKKIFIIFSKNKKIDRNLKWKILNIYLFAKFNKIFIDFRKIKLTN